MMLTQDEWQRSHSPLRPYEEMPCLFVSTGSLL